MRGPERQNRSGELDGEHPPSARTSCGRASTSASSYSVIYGGASQVLLAAGDTAGAARADSVAREVTEELAKGARF